MNPIRPYKIHLLSEALSILSHSSGTQGNEAIVSREAVVYDGRVVHVPVISGNSIRHKMIRDPGAQWLVEQIGMWGSLSIDQANYLFNGGSLSESSINDNLRTIAEMQTLFPLIRLLGGSLRNQVVGGSLFCGRGMLVCEENHDRIRKHLPEALTDGLGVLKNAESYITKYQYTRAEAKDAPGHIEMIAESPEEEGTKAKGDSTRMIYSGQGITPGAVFYHQIVCENVSVLELGALFWSLELWAKKGGTVGGMSRVGHGKMKTQALLEDAETFFGDKFDPGELVAAYIDHVMQHKEECKQWLTDTFPEKGPKASKGKKS